MILLNFKYFCNDHLVKAVKISNFLAANKIGSLPDTYPLQLITSEA